MALSPWKVIPVICCSRSANKDADSSANALNLEDNEVTVSLPLLYVPFAPLPLDPLGTHLDDKPGMSLSIFVLLYSKLLKLEIFVSSFSVTKLNRIVCCM